VIVVAAATLVIVNDSEQAARVTATAQTRRLRMVDRRGEVELVM
jgi:hypothetical protein